MTKYDRKETIQNGICDPFFRGGRYPDPGCRHVGMDLHRALGLAGSYPQVFSLRALSEIMGRKEEMAGLFASSIFISTVVALLSVIIGS